MEQHRNWDASSVEVLRQHTEATLRQTCPAGNACALARVSMLGVYEDEAGTDAKEALLCLDCVPDCRMQGQPLTQVVVGTIAATRHQLGTGPAEVVS